LLFAAFGGDLDRLIYHMKRLAEHSARELRGAMRRPPLGARGVLRIHPWNEPMSLRESGGTSAPTFRVGAFDILGRQARIQCAKETRLFRHEYKEARLARKAGDVEAVFPYGTYGMRVHHNAPIASEPYGGALLTQPGPTLDDIIAEFHMSRGAPLGEEAVQLLDDVPEAFAEEATDLCEEVHMNFEQASNAANHVNAAHCRDANEASDVANSTRARVTVRHRFDKRDVDLEGSRRIITLRDKRRGRPPGAHSPRGDADPPG